MAEVANLAATVGIRTACAALNLPRSTYYRWVCPPQPTAPPAAPRRRHLLALSPV